MNDKMRIPALWKDLTVAPAVVTANQKGNVTLPHDPRKSDGKTAHITITASSHPDLRAELDIPVTYDDNFLANFKGKPGASGTDGTNGMVARVVLLARSIRTVPPQVGTVATELTEAMVRTAKMVATGPRSTLSSRCDRAPIAFSK